MKKTLLFVLVLISFILISLSPTKAVLSVSQSGVTKLVEDKSISNQYIVVYKDDVSSPVNVTNDLELKLNLNIQARYTNTIKGFSAIISKTALETIKKDSRIAFLSSDKELGILTLLPLVNSMSNPSIPPLNSNISVNTDSTNTSALKDSKPTKTPSPNPPLTTTQSSPPTKTVVISKQEIPSGVSRIGLSATNEGEGVGIAILDTGMDLDHPDLSLNIVTNKNCVSPSSDANDYNGHGTAVAGTIAAANNSEGVIGVSPKARLISVKVLNNEGKGSLSSLICGIDWVTENAKEHNIKVVNMSLGAPGSSDNDCGKTNKDALHLAICKSRNSGLTYVAAAGNESVEASSVIPAAYDDAVITISALNDSDGQSGGYGYNTSDGNDDTFASFSNYGYSIDLGAPGVDILTTAKNGRYAKISGTSIAAAHVSGAAALFIKINPDAKWDEVRDGLQNIAEPLNSGHTDPSRIHPEKIVKTNSL